MSTRRNAWIVAAALLVACDGEGVEDAGVPVDAAGPRDAGGRDAGLDAGGRDAGGRDAGGRDAGRRDAGGRDAGLDAGAPDAGAPSWSRYELVDGAVVLGETIATYDHARWWWDTADELTFAVFDPAGLAPWPDDRSLRFLSSLDVVDVTAVDAPAGAVTHRDAMRSRGVALARVPLDGVAHVITAGESYHLEESGYGDFAWDLVRRDASGARFVGDGSRNEDYLVWDAEVRSPVSGIVVELVNDAPDLPPGTPDLDAVNNLIGIQVFGGWYVYLLHMRQNSVPAGIYVGALVAEGQVLGRVGNSGVSAEPHLHVVGLALDRESAPTRTWSVPVEWRDVWVRDGAGARLAPWVAPGSGDDLSNDPL